MKIQLLDLLYSLGIPIKVFTRASTTWRYLVASPSLYYKGYDTKFAILGFIITRD